MKNKAYKLFDNLKLRQSIIIREIAPRDPDSFIQYAKDYIDEFGSLQFNSDYSILTKCYSFLEVKSFDNKISFEIIW